MKYSFKHKNYNDFSVFEENKLPPHSYFIPFSNKAELNKTDYFTERYSSDIITVLNGEWEFKYYKHISEMETDFDSDIVKFDKISVPSMWQYTGYEEPYYVNQRYLFKPNPPHIPKDISIGVYLKRVSLEKVAEREIITFLGVAPNIELYVNGCYAGYSEGSHNTAEFDITKFLKAGENEILALVYKFCNGTYLEAQDMFRSNGIFRDVYLSHRSKGMIKDIAITTEYNGGKYRVVFKTDCEVSEKVQISVSFNGDTVTTLSGMTGEKLSTLIEKPHEWTAETPNLYTAIIEVFNNSKPVECIRQEFGLKHIEIKGNVFLFNNQPIKLFGVNHHDTDESKGYYMTAEDMRRDAEIMKEYNVNCVRTSHYPPDPMFIKMCSHYGLYVVDEADIEAHGVNEAGRPNWISADIAWAEHFWDRVLRMYERDKNNACITMWSLGNEAGGIKCQDYCYENLKKLTDIPIHYEGACRSPRFNYDVVSMMYYGADGCERIVSGKAPKKFYNAPFYLCEYAHAMGVGPGDLDRYADIFLSAENMLGGCIWEFADHAVKHEKGGKYAYEYTYGGDHGEEKHDKNFCVDGLFYPDRTPNSGAIAMKNVYRPIRAEKVIDGQYRLKNIMRFKDSSDIRITVGVIKDGYLADTIEINDIIPPLGQIEVKIDIEKYSDAKDLFLNFIYLNKSGGEIAKEQLIVKEEIAALKDAEVAKRDKKADCISYEFSGGEAVFDISQGMLISYKYNGAEFINPTTDRADGISGFVPTVYRAPIDNYMYVDKIWRKNGLHKLKTVYCGYDLSEDSIILKYNLRNDAKAVIKTEVEYRVVLGGETDVKVTFKNDNLFKAYDLPKLGVSIELGGEYSAVEYYGRGEEECYSDLTMSAVIGRYKTSVEKLFNNYIKPQDNGNHTDLRELILKDASDNGIKIIAKDKPLNFSASRYTLENMIIAKHRENLKRGTGITLNIDGFVRGAGANSCGQDTRKIFRYYLKRGRDFVMNFRIQPIK